MRRAIPLAIVALLSVVVGVSTVAAHTDRIPVAAVVVGAEPIVEGEQSWVGGDHAGTWLVRGAQDRHWWAGDPYLEGEAVVTYDITASFVCAEAYACELKAGRLGGSITIEPDAFEGGWQGTFSFVITSQDEWGFTYVGKIIARGYGELEGLQLRLDARADGTIPPWEGSHTASGFVLVPAA